MLHGVQERVDLLLGGERVVAILDHALPHGNGGVGHDANDGGTREQLAKARGHLFNLDCLPPHKKGDLLIHGHTHVLTVQEKDGMTYINPGSAALPKEGNPKSYMVYDKGVFTIKTLEGETIREHKI